MLTQSGTHVPHIHVVNTVFQVVFQKKSDTISCMLVIAIQIPSMCACVNSCFSDSPGPDSQGGGEGGG